MCKDNNKTPASKMCLCDQSTYRTDNNRCISSKYYMSFIQCISFVYLICNKLFLFYKNQNKNVFYCVVISLSSSDICLYICAVPNICICIWPKYNSPKVFLFNIFKSWVSETEDMGGLLSISLSPLSVSLAVCVYLSVCLCMWRVSV